MTLREFMEERAAIIAKLFHDTGRIHRMYHVVDGDDRHVIIPAPPGDKDTSVDLVRYILRQLRARRYVMFDEGWTASAENDPEEAARMQEWVKTKSLETYPGRKEVLLIAAEDENEGQLMAGREIIRPSRGKAKLGPIEVWEYGRSEGRMVGLLPTRATRQ